MNDVSTEKYPESQPLLTRLLHREEYSLANYLLYAPPWVPPGRKHVWKEVRRIAEAQLAKADSIGKLLVRRYGYAESGLYPVEFTQHNYVSLDYLVPLLVEYQRSLIAEIERTLEQLGHDEEARRVVQTVLDGEQKYLDALLALAPAPQPQRQAA